MSFRIEKPLNNTIYQGSVTGLNPSGWQPQAPVANLGFRKLAFG